MSPSALRRQVGQLLIAGFNGIEIPVELRSLAHEFGLGGVMVEALRDVVFRMVPIGERDAGEMLDGIRGTKLLGELRGDPAVDRVALMGALRRVAQLGNDFPRIAELDANPLLASSAGVVALDARVRLAVAR